MAEETNGHSEEVEHGSSRAPAFASKFQVNEVNQRVDALEEKQNSRTRWLTIAWVLIFIFGIGAAMGLKMGIVANDKANALRDSLAVANDRSVAWQQAYRAEHDSTLVIRQRVAVQQQAIGQLQSAVRRHDDDLADVAATFEAENYASKSEVAAISDQNRLTIDTFVSQQSDSLASFRQWTLSNQEEMEQRYSRTAVGFNDQLMMQRMDIDRLKRKTTIAASLGFINLIWTGVHTTNDRHH
ncbi:MAG: hypothetical protein HY976_01065 [Candidatus Kerfeldbacteria bacterium]|nr:hypothetical protein [Candidatus Kerfeldbacteria bacterium]